jgi:hypothetical protein
MTCKITAPWTPDQVDGLNRFQRAGFVHPFTCPDTHNGADRTLVATRAGWICPHCDYTQNWMHAAMIERFRASYQNAWQAFAMIREAIETLGPVGVLPSSEAVMGQIGPEPVHEAEALVEGIKKLKAESEQLRRERDWFAEALAVATGRTTADLEAQGPKTVALQHVAEVGGLRKRGEQLLRAEDKIADAIRMWLRRVLKGPHGSWGIYPGDVPSLACAIAAYLRETAEAPAL